MLSNRKFNGYHGLGHSQSEIIAKTVEQSLRGELSSLDWVNSLVKDLKLISIILKNQSISHHLLQNLQIALEEIYFNLSGMVALITGTTSFWLQVSNILNLIDLFTTTLEIKSNSRLMTDYVAYLVKMMILSLTKLEDISSHCIHSFHLFQ